MHLPQTPSGHQFRILIVEDDLAILRLAALALKTSGFDIFAARNGMEAWNQMEQVNPHLILADIRMPQLSGPELIERVRRSSAIPILMMSAHDAEDAQMRAFKLGADDYLAKPFTPELLTVRVAASLRRAYRYNGASPSQATSASRNATPAHDSPATSSETDALPRGFVRCDMCSYIGPEWKFNARDTNGKVVQQCPHCRNKTLTFALG